MRSPVNAGQYQEIEDTAFSCYAKHQTELDAIVKHICGGPLCGSLNLAAADDLDESDLRYISTELQKRGYSGTLSLTYD